VRAAEGAASPGGADGSGTDADEADMLAPFSTSPPFASDDDAGPGARAPQAGQARHQRGDMSPLGSEGSCRAGLIWNIPSRGSSSIPSPGKPGGASPQPRSPYHAQQAGGGGLSGGYAQ
jgi:hypothetical protein